MKGKDVWYDVLN